MLPHEGLVTPGRNIFKTDAVGHGEGHQLPGPADIAWDLAGTIVEWELPAAAADYFIRSYRRQIGDNPAARLPVYLLLYLGLRMAQYRIASAAMIDCFDAGLLRRYYLHLRSRV